VNRSSVKESTFVGSHVCGSAGVSDPATLQVQVVQSTDQGRLLERGLLLLLIAVERLLRRHG
jgi:hypothetical protein